MCERHFYRCVDCLTVVAANERLHRAECGACEGAIEYMGRVERDRLIVTGNECPCDDRCTSALGPKCNCKCGGVNHGTNRVVSVNRDNGDVPILVIIDPTKARVVAREWRAAVESATNELATIRSREVNRWLSEEDYKRWMFLGRSLREARKLRTHASRMKRLASVVAPKVEPDDFQLANDPPPRRPLRFDDAEPMKQRPLIDGLNCLPGQLDLFD